MKKLFLSGILILISLSTKAWDQYTFPNDPQIIKNERIITYIYDDYMKVPNVSSSNAWAQWVVSKASEGMTKLPKVRADGTGFVLSSAVINKNLSDINKVERGDILVMKWTSQRSRAYTFTGFILNKDNEGFILAYLDYKFSDNTVKIEYWTYNEFIANVRKGDFNIYSIN
jgi:hypothetical protein